MVFANAVNMIIVYVLGVIIKVEFLTILYSGTFLVITKNVPEYITHK